MTSRRTVTAGHPAAAEALSIPEVVTTRVITGHPAIEACGTCGSAEVVRLVKDWQPRVHAGGNIPILGCGAPWHYVFPGWKR